jgi:hypothetical protein
LPASKVTQNFLQVKNIRYLIHIQTKEPNNSLRREYMTRTNQDAMLRPADSGSEAGGFNQPSRFNEQNNLSDQIKSGVEAIRNSGINEATIPDAFSNMPKFISPRIHAWLDVAVTGYFLTLGTIFAIRRKGGAATAAFVNAGMVAGVSLMTDYEGTGNKPINFKLHGTFDAIQAATATLGPVLHGFAKEPESAFFYGQAANEAAVIAFTDWDEGMPISSIRRSAA